MTCTYYDKYGMDDNKCCCLTCSVTTQKRYQQELVYCMQCKPQKQPNFLTDKIPIECTVIVLIQQVDNVEECNNI